MRTHYNNGDEITLQANGCDGCSPSIINGHLYHEFGCVDAWRDKLQECTWCGTLFYADEQGNAFCCGDCAVAYGG